jgi:hypothetical protein
MMTNDDELETFAKEWERRHGLPIGGRDPAVVDHEIACRRAPAGLLHGRLTGNRDDEHAAMTVVLTECHRRPGLTPAAALVPPLLTLAGYVADGTSAASSSPRGAPTSSRRCAAPASSPHPRPRSPTTPNGLGTAAPPRPPPS